MSTPVLCIPIRHERVCNAPALPRTRCPARLLLPLLRLQLVFRVVVAGAEHVGDPAARIDEHGRFHRLAVVVPRVPLIRPLRQERRIGREE